MTANLECRVALESDLADVLQLYAQPDLYNGNVLPLSEARRILKRMARYPSYSVYVAIYREKIVGTFALLIMDNLGHMGSPLGIIEAVAVDPGWQGRGFGSEMMRHALRVCKEKGCYKAMLSSNLNRERAHAFYESLDFERYGYSFRVDID